MKLYVEIDGEKHYIDEGVLEKYALYEGHVTPITRLKIKKEDDTKVVATEIKETEIPLPCQRQLTIQKPVQILSRYMRLTILAT